MVTLHLKRSTWTLVGGLAAAVIVFAVGTMNAKRLQSASADAWARCDPEAPGKPVPAWDLPATDPIAALEAETAARAVEAACYKKLGFAAPTNAAISASEKWPRVAAAVIAILGALPWAWYFLLRRIAELRAAIGGTPPAG